MRTQYGARLKKFREQAGLTQERVSREMKLTTSQFISNVERGICGLPDNYIPKISKLYGVHPKTLMAMILKQKEQDLLKVIKETA